MNYILFFSIIMGGIVVSSLLAPWFGTSIAPAKIDDERNELNLAKDRLLQSLRDLEMDFATGKTSHSDYSSSRAVIVSSLSTVYSKLDAIGSK